VRRRRNPTPTQWVLMIGSGALVLGLGGAAYAASRRRRATAEEPLGPRLPDVDDGESDEEDDEPSDESTAWEIVTPDDPGYPWEFPALHYENYPTPSTWFNAGDASGPFKPSWGYDRMVRALLGSALAMAGNDPSIAAAEGQQANASLGRRLRRETRDAIMVVGGINDLLYGQSNLNLAGGNDPNKPGGDPARPLSGAYVLNAEGRGLNWLPRHADNLDRIQSGRSLRRTTSVAGRSLPGSRGSRQMLVWMPAFDLAALSPNNPMPSIRFGAWSDGSSTLHPPPAIMRLGIDMSGVELPGV